MSTPPDGATVDDGRTDEVRLYHQSHNVVRTHVKQQDFDYEAGDEAWPTQDAAHGNGLTPPNGSDPCPVDVQGIVQRSAMAHQPKEVPGRFSVFDTCCTAHNHRSPPHATPCDVPRANPCSAHRPGRPGHAPTPTQAGHCSAHRATVRGPSCCTHRAWRPARLARTPAPCRRPGTPCRSTRSCTRSCTVPCRLGQRLAAAPGAVEGPPGGSGPPRRPPAAPRAGARGARVGAEDAAAGAGHARQPGTCLYTCIAGRCNMGLVTTNACIDTW